MKTKAKKKPTKRNKPPVAVTTDQQDGKGGRLCLVCAHPARAEFDKGLMNGSIKPSDVARRVGCSRSSIGRHFKNHLVKTVQTALQAEPMKDNGQDIDLMGELKVMYAKVKKLLAACDDDPNWKAQKAFHGEIRGYLELMGKFLGKLETGTTVNIIVTPVWVQMRTVIIQALEPFPEARIAVAKALTEIDKGTPANVTP